MPTPLAAEIMQERLEAGANCRACPSGHRMKLHNGSRKEGPLTCDGPDDVCCGRDRDGIVHFGEPRFSCERCDYDICVSCVELDPNAKHEDVAEQAPEPMDARESARQRLREKLETRRRGPVSKTPAPAPDPAPDPVPAPAATEASLEADQALRAAIEAADLEVLKETFAAQRESASAEMVAEAKRVLERLKKTAKKAAQKQRRDAASLPSANAAHPSTDAAHPSIDAAHPSTEADVTEAGTTYADATDVNDVPLATEEAAPSATLASVSSFKFSAPQQAASQQVTPASASSFKFSAPKQTAASTTSSAGLSNFKFSAPTEPASPAQSASPAVVTFKFDSPPPKQAPAPSPAPAVDDANPTGMELLPPPANPLLCPFTGELFLDPVCTADGYTFERKEIGNYLESHDCSPLTGERLAHKDLVVNRIALELCRKALAL